jgi:molecular chaperone HscC
MTTIGIDLGTTNSLVAYWTDKGPQIIPNVLRYHHGDAFLHYI